MGSSRQLSFLGLLNKGGNLIIGEALDCQRHLALLIVADDAGKDAQRRAESLINKLGPILMKGYSKSQLGQALGKDEVSLVGISSKKAALALLGKAGKENT